MLYADFSEQSVCSIFIRSFVPAYGDLTKCFNTSAYKIQSPGKYPEESIRQERINFTLHYISDCCALGMKYEEADFQLLYIADALNVVIFSLFCSLVSQNRRVVVMYKLLYRRSYLRAG